MFNDDSWKLPDDFTINPNIGRFYVDPIEQNKRFYVDQENPPKIKTNFGEFYEEPKLEDLGDYDIEVDSKFLTILGYAEGGFMTDRLKQLIVKDMIDRYGIKKGLVLLAKTLRKE